VAAVAAVAAAAAVNAKSRQKQHLQNALTKGLPKGRQQQRQVAS